MQHEHPGHYACRRFRVSCNNPINDSLSVTLNNDNMKTYTTILLCQLNNSSPGVNDEKFSGDRMYLNDQEIDMSPRYRRLLHIARTFISNHDPTLGKLFAEDRITFCVITKNFFPTAVGLASSASGSSAFAGALKRLCDKISTRDSSVSYSIPHPTVLARFGSGSGCRSLCDGFALWKSTPIEHCKENEPCAVSIASSQHWTSLHILILVFPFCKGQSSPSKEISSARGMETSLRSSPFVHQLTADGFQSPVKADRITRLTKAILHRDFSTVAEITMTESDELHAICSTSTPVIRYLNRFSETMIQFIRRYNSLQNVICETKDKYYCAYSFDAGPNMFLFCEEPHIAEIFAAILDLFPGTAHESCFLQKPLNEAKQHPHIFDEKLQSLIAEYASSLCSIFEAACDAPHSDRPYLPYVYHSTPGGGVVV